MTKTLELACFDLDAAKIAIAAGVDRIEFCSEFSEGGLTPDADEFIELRKLTNIPLFVMIRPRGGDFIYTADELDQMALEIDTFKFLGANGFVFGVLTDDGLIDTENCQLLLEIAEDLPCTFHRAFDDIIDKTQALQQLISLGFKRVLTSAGPGSIVNNLDTFKLLNQQANRYITLIPGGGLRAENLGQILAVADLIEVHSSGITTNSSPLPDVIEIQKMMALLNG